MSSVIAAFSDIRSEANEFHTKYFKAVKMHREKYHPIINHSKCIIRV